MKNFLICSLFMISSLTLLADDVVVLAPAMPSGIVTKIKGSVLFEGQPVAIGAEINKAGKIETKDKSYLQIKIDKWKNTISIGPNSVMELNFSDEKKYSLEGGTCRWKSFGQSELIMFEGEVMMDNLSDKSNTALVKKGQWGGIGGRFGEKISPILDLPEALLISFEKSLE